MKSFLLGLVAAIVVLPIGALAYFRMGWADAQGDTPPPVWESRLMNKAVHTAVAKSAATLGRPLPGTGAEGLVQGGKLYMEGCAGCHGELGKPFTEDRDHYPPVPQLFHTGTQYTEPQIYWVVKHGVRMTAMSAYGRFYTEEQLWAIAAFLHQCKNLPNGVAEQILAKPASASPAN